MKNDVDAKLGEVTGADDPNPGSHDRGDKQDVPTAAAPRPEARTRADGA